MAIVLEAPLILLAMSPVLTVLAAATHLAATIASSVRGLRAIGSQLLRGNPLQLINTAQFIEQLSLWALCLLQGQGVIR